MEPKPPTTPRLIGLEIIVHSPVTAPAKATPQSPKLGKWKNILVAKNGRSYVGTHLHNSEAIAFQDAEDCLHNTYWTHIITQDGRVLRTDLHYSIQIPWNPASTNSKI